MSAPSPLYVLPFGEVRHRVPSTDGVIAMAYEWGGDGPPLVFAHATGLHSHCYAPLVQRLQKRFYCYGIDVRGQGGAGVPDNGNYNWTTGGAQDFVHALDLLHLSGRGDVYGIGHSQGGALVMMGETHRPGTFAGIFGFEPVVFPASIDTGAADNHMAVAARKRREVFPSKQAAYDNYRAKLPFSTIDDECLRAYVEWGFEVLPDGTARVRCRAENEALLFEGARGHSNELCKSVKCPTTVGLGEYTNDGFKMAVPKQAEVLPHGRLVHFDGRSHFGLLERVDEMAEFIITTFLGS